MRTCIVPVALGAAAMLTGGCAQIPQYVAPPREGNAVLEFAQRDYNLIMFHENGEDCTEIRRLGPQDNPLQNPARAMVLPATHVGGVPRSGHGWLHDDPFLQVASGGQIPARGFGRWQCLLC
jgi:hypothetical protein